MGRGAPGYDRTGPQFFGEVAARLVGLVNIEAGARVLDVATGPGVVLLAVNRAQPRAYLFGTDLAAPMVAEARARLAAAGTAADVRVMDAERLDFPDASFDHVFCASALYQFPNPERAASEVHRVTRRTGTFAASVFGDDDPRWKPKDDLFGHLTPDLEQVGRGFDTDALRALLGAAGFADVSVSTHHFDIQFADAAEWLASAWTHGERRALEAMSSTALDDFEAALPDALAATKEADGILHWRPEVVFALAHKD